MARLLSRSTAILLVALLSACAEGSMRPTETPDRKSPAVPPSTEAATAAVAVDTPPPAAVPGDTPAEGTIGRYLAGKVAEDGHDFSNASALLEQALLADPDNMELMLRVTICLAAEGRMAESATVARRLAAFDPDAFVAAFVLAEQRAKEKDWAGVQHVVAGLPNRGVTLLLIPLIDAWAKMGEGEIDAALATLKPLEANPSMGAIYNFHVALINDLADRQAAAAEAYDATLQQSAGLTLRAVEAASEFFRRIGQPEKAAAILQRFHEARPETTFDGEPDGVRAVSSASDGLAEAFFGTAQSIRPGNAPELSLAFDHLALDLRPDFPLAQILLAETLQGAGQLEAADQAFQGVRRSSPFYWSGQLRIADNLDHLGHYEEALRILTDVSARFPKRNEPLIAVGELLQRHEKWGEAVTVYDRAISLLGPPEGGQWFVYYARGIVEERNHQWDRAEADLLHALDLQPNEPQLLNYLGYSWLEQGTHLDRAMKMIQQAVALRPEDGAIVDSMGWAQYHRGEFGTAVETLQHAVELDPADASINDHLGDALWRVGRQNEARFLWRHALLFSPEPDLQAKIAKKLKMGLPMTPVSPVHGGTVAH